MYNIYKGWSQLISLPRRKYTTRGDGGDTLSELAQKQKTIPYLPLLGSPVEYKADGALSVAITLTL